MASVVNPLLSIAIPTYNRSRFLYQTLESLFSEIQNENYSLEIIVSDNCSTDNTEKVIHSFINKGLPIIHVKNIENKGAEVNVIQCFSLAKGNYVLVLGDDDFFLKGALSKIFAILHNESDIGILHITGNSYNEKFEISGDLVSNKGYSIYEDKLSFIKRVHYNLTFISANILNKKLCPANLDLEVFNGTMLPQLSWTLPILNSSNNNIFLNDTVLGVGSVENTGKYKLFEVFATNFNKIMRSPEPFGLPQEYINVINNNLISSFFPEFIYSTRKSAQSNFSEELPDTVLRKEYKAYILYWICIQPLTYLPLSLARYWFHGSKMLTQLIGKSI